MPAGRTLAVATAATALTLLDVTVVYLALPALGSDLGATFTQQQWVIDAYAVAMAATLLAFGALADRSGRRRVFVGGLVVFGVASAACAAAPGGDTLALARALQGLGAAALVTTSLALIASAYEGPARARALGIWGAVSGAALAAGPIVGGVVIDGLGWRWVFALNVPLVVAIAALARGVPETRDPSAPRPDLAGAALFTGGLGLVIAGLLRGPEDGWEDGSTVAMLGAGAALLIAFGIVELRRRAPMLDPRLFGDRRLAATTAVAFLQSVAIYPMLLFLAVDLQVVHGFGPLDAGLRVLPVTATLLVAAVVTGRLTERVPHRVTLGIGLIGTAVGLLLLRGGAPSDEWTVLLPGFLVLGAGLGVLSPSLAAAIMASLPARQGGMASAIGNTARQAGIAAGVAVLGAVFSAAATGAGDAQTLLSGGAQSDVAKTAFLSGLDAALSVAAGVAFVGAAVAGLVTAPSLSSGSKR